MKLGDIANVNSGQIISRVEAKEEVGDVFQEKEVLIPKAISNGRVIHADLGSVKLKKDVDGDRITRRGDVVLKLSTPYDAAYIEENDEGLVVPSFCVVIRGLREKADPQFVTAFLNTEHVKQIFRAKVAGTTMPLLKLSDVRDLEIPNVSMEKQKLLGEAYGISCEKQDLLKEMLNNEQVLMDSLVLKAVKEAS